MMSPRSFLATRQQDHYSPSSSPSQSPRASPRASPRPSPLHSPAHSPHSPSPLSNILRRDADLPSWESLTANTPLDTHSHYTTKASPAPTLMSVTVTSPPRGGPTARKTANNKSLYLALTPEKTETTKTEPSEKTAPSSRPTTPTTPVQIPVKTTRHETAHAHKPKHRHHHHHQNADVRRGLRNGQPQQPWTSASGAAARRPARDMHSPDAIPPSVAALLAVTNIPPPRPYRSLHPSRSNSTDRLVDRLGDRMGEKRMTVNSIIARAQEAEQEFSLSLSKSPLDVLLTAPEDFEDEDDLSIVSDSTMEPGLSTRAVSLESMPSLSDSFATGTVSSCETPLTPDRVRRLGGRKTRPTRKSMTPIASPPGERCDSDPLSAASLNGSDSEFDGLDFRVFQSPDPLAKTSAAAEARSPLQPLKSAFKSNLTASLRALRNAARSFSTLNLAASIPPEDFLTRSILTIDPHIPYTDERRPPPLEEEPSAALRRYLNPTTGPHMDPRTSAVQLLSPAVASAALPYAPAHGSGSGGVPAGIASSSRSGYTASIQMQTYRVHRSKHARGVSPAGASSTSSSSSSSSSSASGLSSDRPRVCGTIDDRQFPGPRQRELRENSDFIRIAVMEMAMRRVGKLDDRKPGRARLALPPRKMGGKPYVVGADGVPARWVGVTSE